MEGYMREAVFQNGKWPRRTARRGKGVDREGDRCEDWERGKMCTERF